jgi:hypothetical protein
MCATERSSRCHTNQCRHCAQHRRAGEPCKETWQDPGFFTASISCCSHPHHIPPLRRGGRHGCPVQASPLLQLGYLIALLNESKRPQRYFDSSRVLVRGHLSRPLDLRNPSRRRSGSSVTGTSSIQAMASSVALNWGILIIGLVISAM